jgi:competence CoiA-like predicted nuclease
MQFDANRNKPTPSAVSECPACHTKIVAKCGSIKVWHWAHESLINCDANWEPTSEWHLWWQSHVHEDLTEVINNRHIADIKLTNGKVIEVQHSNLPVEVVSEREAFYGNMTWIFDGQEFYKRLRIKEKEFMGEPSHSFSFKHPRQYIVQATKFPFYIDFGSEGIFEVRGIKIYENYSETYEKDYKTYFIYGLLRDKDEDFLKELFGSDYVSG